MAGRWTNYILGAAQIGKLRHGTRTVRGDAGPGSWRKRKLWMGGRLTQKVGTFRMNSLKIITFATARREARPPIRPFRPQARIGKTRDMDHMAILLGTPPRQEGQDRPQMPPPPGGGGFRSRLNVKETTRRSRTDIALGAGQGLPGDPYG